MAEPVKVDVLQFMSLRQPATVDEDAQRRYLIHDVRGSRQAASLMSVSALGQESDFVSLVVREVFCTDDPTDKKLLMKVSFEGLLVSRPGRRPHRVGSPALLEWGV
jgi:hypothetical protein